MKMNFQIFQIIIVTLTITQNQVKYLQANKEMTCQLKNGILYCWGRFNDQQIGNPQLANNKIVNYSIGLNHICLYNEFSHLQCFGENENNQLKNEFIRKIQNLASGQYHNCLITDNGLKYLFCWGDNTYGQIDIPKYLVFEYYQDKKNPLVNYQANHISLGHRHTCAITNQQLLTCWGANDQSQLNIPIEFSRNVLMISSLSHTSCVIIYNNTMNCWGLVEWWESKIPMKLKQDASQVSVGEGHVCVLNGNNEPQCFGFNNQGQSEIPSVFWKYHQWRLIEAGGQHSCAQRIDGKVFCWGFNHQRQSSVPDIVNA